jgi:hypothetical protein
MRLSLCAEVVISVIALSLLAVAFYALGVLVALALS